MTPKRAGEIRVGVVGCGVIAYWVHLRLLQKMNGVRLVAASDPDAAARERATRIVSVPICADSHEIIHNPEIDAVVICAPTGVHADLAVDSLNAGKHVFVEKPIAATIEDARRVIAAADRSQLTAMVGFSRRLHPLYQQARRLIASNELGSVHAVQSAFCEPVALTNLSEWRQARANGGGVLLDLGSHHFDLVRWFLHDEVASVDCSTESDQADGHTARVSMSMSGGATVQSFFSYRTARADYLEFICERGTLMLDRHRPSLSLRVSRRFGYGTRSKSVMPDRRVSKWRARRLTSPSYEPSYANALDAFARSIRGEAVSECSLADAAKSLEIVLAAEESASINSRVTLQG